MTFDQLWRWSDAYSKSGLAPKGLEKPEALFVAGQLCLELGIPPTSGIQHVAVINGRATIYGDMALALVQQSAVFDHSAFAERWEGDGDALTAYCTVRRLPAGNLIERSFSISDAKRALLMGKDSWKGYPRRMLQMRARSHALRDGFSDILRGVGFAEVVADQPVDPVRDAIANRPAGDQLDGVAEMIEERLQSDAKSSPAVLENTPAGRLFDGAPDAGDA